MIPYSSDCGPREFHPPPAKANRSSASEQPSARLPVSLPDTTVVPGQTVATREGHCPKETAQQQKKGASKRTHDSSVQIVSRTRRTELPP
jgi:hypothetical protein